MKNNVKRNIVKIGTFSLLIIAMVLAMAVPAVAEVAAPSKLVFITSPTGTGPGGFLVPQTVVAVQDAGGNTVTNSTATISIAIGSNADNATLSGTTTVNAVKGVATFRGLRITPSGNGYTLTASSAGLNSATSASFNVTTPTANVPPTRTNIPLRTLQGIVVSVGNNQFTIQSGSQTPVSVDVGPDTKYFVISTGRVQSYVNNQVAQDNRQDEKNGSPKSRAQDLRQSHIPADWRSDLGWLSTFDKQAQFSDIKVNDRIVARVNSDTSPLATQVMIIKARSSGL